MNYSIKFN